jgi:hypothetical protein
VPSLSSVSFRCDSRGRDAPQGANITFDMFGKAIAEFEFTLVFADAPIDQFARGQKKCAHAESTARGAPVERLRPSGDPKQPETE